MDEHRNADTGIGTDEGTPSDGSAPDATADVDEPVVDDRDGTDGQPPTGVTGNGDGGIFDDLLDGEAIFEAKELLRPSYTPTQLPHRSEQINEIASILVSALRGNTPSNIIVYGKTGTGKTASARLVSQELKDTSRDYPVPCDVEHINCEVTDTQYRVLATLANRFIEDNLDRIDDEVATLRANLAEGDGEALAARGVDSPAAARDRIADLEAYRESHDPVPMTGWPTDRVYAEFFEAVDLYQRVVVIMLDEVDKLVEKSGDDTLYNLSRMNADLDRSRVSIIGISNDLNVTECLDPRVKSSLGEEEIVFPPYDAAQITDILRQRADAAFKPDALADGVIPLCAAFAAQEHGDARRALDLLRTAGELAERSQDAVVAESHVREAQETIELDRIVEAVRTLPTQSKLILLAIVRLEDRGTDPMNTGEVFNEYRDLCRAVDVDVLTQRRVTDLVSELDMLGIVTAAVVSKGRYGRTKEISLSVPKSETCAVLTSDSRLADLEGE